MLRISSNIIKKPNCWHMQIRRFSPLRIGDTLPNFVQDSTKGSFNLHEQIGGSWCLLFIHPKQFPAVSSSEIVEIEKLHEEFHNRNAKVVSLSQDTLENTAEWTEYLKSKNPDVKFNHPWIADHDGSVSKLLARVSAGTVDSGTKPEETPNTEIRQDFATRMTLLIDPHLQLRGNFMYPNNVGRSIQEFLRVLDGVQLADKRKVSLPAEWKPGDKVIVDNKDADKDAKPYRKYLTVHL